jgi:hypothetical protein
MTKRITLFVTVTAIALFGGFFWPGQWLVQSFHHTGYYFILISVFAWLVVIIRLFCHQIKPFFKNHYKGLIVSFVLTGLIFMISPPQFKILADESNLIGVSMSMHQNKTTSIPVQGLNLNFEKFQPTSVVNKRPILYPFVVSIFHAVLGYSPYNGFIVNFICGAFILFLFYVFMSRFYPRYLAILSILIFAAFPVFGIWITSSGFEGLNLLFIIIFFLIYHQFLQNQDAPTAELLFLTLVLLMQCRYESLIFGIVILTMIRHLVRKDLIKQYSIFAWITPLLIVPILWQRRIFLHASEPVRMHSNLLETSGHGFHLQSFFINLSKNIFTFSGIDPNYGFILIVSILSIFGAYLLIKEALTKSAEMTPQTRHVVFAGTIMFILLCLIYSSYQWGNFNLPISNRLAVVFLPFFVFAAIHFFHRIPGNVRINTKIFLFIFWSLNLVYFWPYASNQKIVHTLELTCEYNQVLNYLDRNYNTREEKILLISDRPSLYFIHGYGSINFAYANARSAEIDGYSSSYYDRILVLQRCLTETRLPLENNRLNSGYKLVGTDQIKCLSNGYIQLSEVWSLNPAS